MRTFTLRIIMLVALLASGIAGYSAPPSVNLGNDTAICDDGSFITLDAGFFPGATYEWDDGTFGQTRVVYGPGIYSVTVDVGGETGFDEKEVTFLTPSTSAQFSWSATGTCLPVTVNFTDESTTSCTSIIAWEWDFGDGTTSSDQHPSHEYTTPGPQNVTLKITNSQGDQDVIPYTVDYSSKIVNPFDLGGDVEICPGGSELLIAPTAPILPVGTTYTYLWSTGATTQSLGPGAAGTYSVVVTNNWGCTASDSKVITVASAPVVNLGNDTTICSINSLTLDAGNPGSTYLWESGDVTQTLYVDFPGSYSVIVTSPGGCVAKDTLVLDMLPSLLADFAFTQSGTCLPVTATFTDNSLKCGVTITWAWDFGDGQTSSAQNPIHNYAVNGTYDVTLTITDNLGNSLTTSPKPITIAGLPSPVVNLGPDATICSIDALTLDAGNPGSTYFWALNEEVTQTAIADFPGQYSVKVTGANGCSASDTMELNMNPSLLANFGFVQSGTCLPISVAFHDSTLICGVTIASWAWDFDDGQTSSAQHPTHNYAANGTYTVTLTVTDNLGNILTKSIPVTVSGFATPVVNLGADTIICSINALTLDAGNPGSSYVWESGETAQTLYVDFPGPYSVIVTSPSGCVAKDTIQVDMLPSLYADFNFTQSGTCLPVTATFTDNSLTCGTTISTWAWDFGDGNSSSAQNPTHNYAVNGTYDVYLTVTDNLGNSLSQMKQIIIAGIPSPVVNLGNDTTICSINTLTLDAGNPGSTYIWRSGETAQTLVVNFLGTYWVRVTNPSGCTSSDTLVLSMTPSVLTNFGYVETTNCVPANVDFKDSTTTCGVTIASWAWDFGDGQTSTAQNPSHTYAAAGTYSVTLTATDNLGNSLPKNIPVIVAATGMPIVNLGADTTICSINALTLDAGNPGSSYVWESGETAQTLYVDFPGPYSVIVTSPSGCVAKDTIQVDMLPSLYADFNFTQSGTCLPVTATFTDNSLTCGTTISTWAWDFGDGNLSSAQNPTHDYAVNGTYDVYLTVTDNFGNSLSQMKQIIIAGMPSPIVNLGNDTTICSMDALTLDAGNPGSAYEWGFGGEIIQTISADFPATYTVKVTGANGCVSTDTMELKMNPSLFPNFGYAITGACLPQTVNFSDSSTVCGVTITGWLWDFGDGQTSSDQNPAHIYTGNEPFTVTLTVTDNLGNSLTSPQLVTISAFTPASIYLGADTTICSGSSVTLDGGNPGSTYLWSTGASSQTIVATSGSYWVQVTTPGGCVSTDTINVTSNAMPVFSLGADRIACGNITLDAYNPGMTYVWSTGETTSDLEVMSSGTYSVTVTNLPGCIKSDTVNITFQQPVVPQIGQSYAGTCNNMVQFTDNSIICTTVSIVSRTWDFGDGTTSTQLNPSHNYTANGTYVVKLTLNDDQGGVNVRTSSVSVMVNPPVPALGNDIDVCPGTPVTLNAGTTGGIYKWFPAGLTSDSTSPTLTFIPTGDMNVKLSVTGCNQTGWDSIRIYVRNNTKPTLTMVGKALQSSAANSYNWFVNSTLIPSATNKMYTPKQPGYYQVGTINDYLCPSLSDSVFYMPTGRFKAGEVIIRLSPNPTKGVFTVWLSKAPTKPVRMEIFTADGKLAYNTLIHSQVSTIYPGHLTRGTYMVRFIINGSVETVPLIEL